MRFYHNSFMINPKASSTYSLEPSLKFVRKAGKPEHYLAGLSHRIITISIPPLLWAQQRSSLGVGGRVDRMGRTEVECKVVFMGKKRRLFFKFLHPGLLHKGKHQWPQDEARGRKYWWQNVSLIIANLCVLTMTGGKGREEKQRNREA